MVLGVDVGAGKGNGEEDVEGAQGDGLEVGTVIDGLGGDGEWRPDVVSKGRGGFCGVGNMIEAAEFDHLGCIHKGKGQPVGGGGVGLGKGHGNEDVAAEECGEGKAAAQHRERTAGRRRCGTRTRRWRRGPCGRLQGRVNVGDEAVQILWLACTLNGYEDGDTKGDGV